MNRSTLLQTLTLLVSLVPRAESQEIATIPLPSLCSATPPPPAPRALRDGSHIVLRVDSRGGSAKRAPFLASPLLTRMLEQQARETESNLRVIPGDRPLLVTGNAAAIELARATARSLDEAGRRLEIKLEVQLFPGDFDASALSSSALSAPGKRTWTTTIRSGEEAFFGTRERLPFLSTFDVEVSADAGAAYPVVGYVYLGKTLHLTAHRIHGGRHVHLNGVLDLSELLSTTEFDPENLDLGRVQQPELASTVVQFSDVITSSATGEFSTDGACVVALRGLPLSKPDWNLLIRATTALEPEPGEVPAGEPRGWALLDLAFLSAESAELPGSAYAEDWEGAAEVLPRAFPAWNANAVQGLLQSAVPGVLEPAPGRGLPLIAGKGLVLLDRRAQSAWRAAVSLVEAAESARSYGGRLKLLAGGSTSFEVPFTANQPLRIQSGIERTYLTDYNVEIAPETWMPVPEVSTYFEGIQLDAGLGDPQTLVCELSRRGVSERGRRIEADVTSQGVVQWPKRSVNATRVLSRLGAAGVSVFNDDEDVGSHVHVSSTRRD